MERERIEKKEYESIKCEKEHSETDITIRYKNGELYTIYCNNCGYTIYIRKQEK